MKKIKLTSMIVLLTIIFLTSAFTNANEIAGETVSCTVIVIDKYGKLASDLEVSVGVGGGLLCAGITDFKTNSKGEVKISWPKGCKAVAIYIKGDKYTNKDNRDGYYEEGKTYRFNLK